GPPPTRSDNYPTATGGGSLPPSLRLLSPNEVGGRSLPPELAEAGGRGQEVRDGFARPCGPPLPTTHYPLPTTHYPPPTTASGASPPLQPAFDGGQGGQVAVHAVAAGSRRGGGRAQENPVHRGGVGVGAGHGPEDELGESVGTAGHVAADQVGIVGLEFGRGGDDPRLDDVAESGSLF